MQGCDVTKPCSEQPSAGIRKTHLVRKLLLVARLQEKRFPDQILSSQFRPPNSGEHPLPMQVPPVRKLQWVFPDHAHPTFTGAADESMSASPEMWEELWIGPVTS